MARPTLDADKSTFLTALKASGGYQGNQSLRAQLSWSEDRYWRVHGLLNDDGAIIRGRGKGGSVSLAEEPEESLVGAPEVEIPITPEVAAFRDEKDLYEPAKLVVEQSWARERAFDSHVVEITASPGGKKTGGTWTRPDLSVLATKAYPYYPNRIFEIVTFEIKTDSTVNVTGLFEALSHSQFATLSYVLFHTNGKDFDKDLKDTQRIVSLAAQHGVGLIVANDIAQYSSWDERVIPRRNTPDPEQANTFISTCFTEASKQIVLKWHR